MKKIDDEKWLKDLFSEQATTKPSAHFEANLMQRIFAIEAEVRKKEEIRNRRRELWAGVLTVFIALAATVFVFGYFGLYKNTYASITSLIDRFALLKMDAIVVIPIISIFMLLIGDLFARKYFTKE